MVSYIIKGPGQLSHWFWWAKEGGQSKQEIHVINFSHVKWLT